VFIILWIQAKVKSIYFLAGSIDFAGDLRLDSPRPPITTGPISSATVVSGNEQLV
jgi:hypothetical protein